MFILEILRIDYILKIQNKYSIMVIITIITIIHNLNVVKQDFKFCPHPLAEIAHFQEVFLYSFIPYHS